MPEGPKDIQIDVDAILEAQIKNEEALKEALSGTPLGGLIQQSFGVSEEEMMETVDESLNGLYDIREARKNAKE